MGALAMFQRTPSLASGRLAGALVSRRHPRLRFLDHAAVYLASTTSLIKRRRCGLVPCGPSPSRHPRRCGPSCRRTTVNLFGSFHLWITPHRGVLGRTGGRNQRGVNHRAGAQHSSPWHQRQFIDQRQDGGASLCSSSSLAEPQHRRFCRRPCSSSGPRIHGTAACRNASSIFRRTARVNHCLLKCTRGIGAGFHLICRSSTLAHVNRTEALGICQRLIPISFFTQQLPPRHLQPF